MGDRQVILVVDDDDLVRSGLMSDLDSMGFAVRAVSSGEECLRILEQEAVDLVLLDLVMDGLDGIHTLQHLRQRNIEVPVIINTAFGTLGTATDALRLGASDFLLKPSSSEEIAHRIQKVLEETKVRQLAQEAEGAERRLRSLQTLAGGIAHDLNNQLTVVLSNVSSLLDRIPLIDPAHEELQEVYASANAMAKMGQKLLGYAGGGHFEIEVIDLAAQLPGILKKLALKLRSQTQHSVRLSLNLEGERFLVHADRNELSDVLDHLLTNAFEALTGQEDRIDIGVNSRIVDSAFIDEHVSLARLQPGPYVCIRVTDNGAGMDTATLDNAFDPFFSTKFTGRGMGLSTVQGILTGHGGGILLQSRPGQGTTAEVLLPLDTNAEVQPPPAPHTTIEIPIAPPPVTEAPRAADGHILIIDDETMVRRLAEKALLKMGYQVQAYSNGPDGLAALERDTGGIQLVLLDLVMPDMDGQEVLQEIRKMRPGIKVLLTSGFHSSDVANRFETVRPDGFLAKPYPISELREKVRALMGD